MDTTARHGSCSDTIGRGCVLDLVVQNQAVRADTHLAERPVPAPGRGRRPMEALLARRGPGCVPRR